MTGYPEHDKWMARKAEAEAIQQFVDWLEDSKGDDAWFCVCRDDEWYPLSDRAISKLISEFIDVDHDQMMAEKDAMLEAIRNPENGTNRGT